MIRFIVAIIFVVAYCIFSIPMLGVMCIVRLFSVDAAEKAVKKIVQGAFHVIVAICGVRVEVRGAERIPKDEAVLFVANHQSFFDVIIPYMYIPRLCGYVAKKEFEKIPVLSWNMKFLKCLFLDRDDLKQGMETIKTAIQYIKDGISVFIFPEGTRNKTGDDLAVREFHKGSFKMAQRTGCKIIPVAMVNTASIWEKHYPTVKPTHVIIDFGEPIAYTGLTKDQQRHIDVYYHDMIVDMIRKDLTDIRE
ncbi:MAG: lysophospholipid acyltransferase family protein [Lachnospiraceae bacterium]|nr:lysophospholipid acyltransferase family protein [Lachnospiraceae bacterium]